MRVVNARGAGERGRTRKRHSRKSGEERKMNEGSRGRVFLKEKKREKDEGGRGGEYIRILDTD